MRYLKPYILTDKERFENVFNLRFLTHSRDNTLYFDTTKRELSFYYCVDNLHNFREVRLTNVNVFWYALFVDKHSLKISERFFDLLLLK